MHITKNDDYDLTKITYPAEYETVRIPCQKCFPPRSFQGYQPLAYVRDLLTLQRRVVKWLTGSEDIWAITSLISSYGFLPLNVSGLADSRYFGVQTEYNTRLINNKVIDYNFFGKNVKVTQSAQRTDKVNIEIRQLKCASNLGTTDGLTDGNVYLSQETQINTTTGTLPDLFSISDPNINFGDWSDRENINIDKYSQNRFQVETKDYINFANSGTFFVIALVTPNNKTTNVVQSEIITPLMMQPELIPLSGLSGISNVILAGQNRNIIFSIHDWQTDDGDTYKAKIKVSFNLNEIFKDENYESNVCPTRFKIIITHHNYDVTSFQTYLNWDHWLQCDTEINDYIKENMYTWESKDYLYITGEQVYYDDITYKFINDLHFKSSNIDQIYSGNLAFEISNIVNLYNLASVDNNIIITTNVTQNQIISSEIIPSTSIAQANQNIGIYTVVLPLKENIYTNIISAHLIIKNAYSMIQEDKIFTLNSSYINTLSSNYISNEIQEYFYDLEKENNEYFGQKYRITTGLIDITQNDLQVIPGSGLFYNQNIQNYVRIFTNKNINDKIKLTFINLNVKDIDIFKNNLQVKINDTWQQLTNYIEETYSKDNNLYLLIKPIILENILLKINIDNNIINQHQLICSSIKFDNSPINSEEALNKLILEVEYLKTLLLT